MRILSLVLVTLLATAPALLTGCSSGGVRTEAVREYKNEEGLVDEIMIVGSGASNADLAILKEATDLTKLTIQECNNLSDAGFESASGAKGLTSLSIMHTPITDAALDAFSGCTELNEVRFVNTNLTGSGLQNFSNSPVEKVMLQGEKFTADGMASLASLTSAKELKLIGRNLNLGDAKGVSSMTSLEKLTAEQAQVGKGGLAVLEGLAGLKELEVSSSEIGDSDIATLNTLVGLESLVIKNSALTDEGLKNLKLPNLKYLNLLGSQKITEAGLELDGLVALEELNIQGTSVEKDLTPLGTLKNLKTVHLSRELYLGGKDEVQALQDILPDVDVSIVAE